MGKTTSTADNRLLSALSADAIQRLDLEYVKASFGDELLPADDVINHLYFPTTAVIALVGAKSDGQTAEIGVIGSEGAVGLVPLLGARSSPYNKLIQKGGGLIRVPVKAALQEFQKGDQFHKDVLSFVQKFTNQVAQITLCNRWHTIDQRMFRWLLMFHDRVEGDVIMLTHQFLSLMLGASRVRVTQAAQRLQALGCIKYSRGKLTIIDRAAMEAHACECYQAIRHAYAEPMVGNQLTAP